MGERERSIGMGDISELRGLVTIVTFLGITFLLISLIPPQFYTATSGREISIPEIFDAIDIYQFAETKVLQTNETGGTVWIVDNSYYRVDIDIGNHDVDLYYKRPNYSSKNVWILHRYTEWIIFPVIHRLDWINSQGESRGDNLALASLNLDAVDGVAKYQARCWHFTLFTQIGYNTTTYSSVEMAWNAGNLYFFFGINFNDVGTAFNVWNLIGMLLFFQLPDTHPIINAIIAIPIWVSVAYLIYVLIIKIIPFIAG